MYTTAVGYAGGHTPNPTYEEVCSGAHRPHRGRAGGLRPGQGRRYETLLSVFWENHDPTQGMRQGNDVGTQYRSAIYCYGRRPARGGRGLARGATRRCSRKAGYGAITTEIREAPEFYYAEDYHQQYLAKNPGGYCGLGGTGVACPAGLAQSATAS